MVFYFETFRTFLKSASLFFRRRKRVKITSWYFSTGPSFVRRRAARESKIMLTQESAELNVLLENSRSPDTFPGDS